ncbi:MAG: ABC-F family ATP-binding cassette domain-containing protein [Nitrospirae bacterium]|nr:ABC-F family ATP-binding cassette domain-containing protein [Nitrospirota bacterium]
MLTLSRIRKAYGGRVLFDGVSLHVGARERVALVGPNGAGKTTLFEMIAGRLSPDDGDVLVQKGVVVGYLPQEIIELKGRTILQEVLSVSAAVNGIEHRMTVLQAEMAEASDDELEALLAEYGELQHRFEALGGYNIESRAREILSGLGFRPEALDRPTDHLSGGWLMRVSLAKLLLQNPDLLLLDEPTNHLDLESVVWLEGFLAAYPGSVLLISHDREFMNHLVSRVVEVDQGQLIAYPGNYDEYLEAREAAKELLMASYANQQKRIQEVQLFVERFRSKATKARQVQSRVKMLEKMDRIKIPPARKKIRFGFPQPPRSGREVVELTGVRKAYPGRVIYDRLDLIVTRGQRVALVGPNGAGKSTLLKMLAGVLPPDGGTITYGQNVTIAYYAQHQLESLDPKATVIEEITAAAPDQDIPFLRGILGAFLFSGDEVKKRVAVLSGGEKSRLALAKMLVRPANFLLLDEPTNHLDIPSRDVLEAALLEYTGTMCFITHDRHFIQAVANTVLEVNGGTATVYPDGYEYYLDKKAAQAAAAAGATKGSVPSPAPASAAPDVGPARATGKSREQRRREAEERARRSVQTKPLKTRLDLLERELGEQGRELEQLTSSLGEPDFYQDKRRFFEAMERHAHLQKSIDRLTSEWGELQERYDTLMREANGTE